MSGLSGGQDVFGTVHDEPHVPRVRASLRARAGILSGSDVRELGTGRHLPGCARDSGAATPRASDRNRLGRGVRSDDPHDLRSHHLPGLWVTVGGILAYGWLTDFRTVGVATIAIVLGLAFLGEIIENWIGFRYAKRYGGATRSGWGALTRGVGGGGGGVAAPRVGRRVGAV